MVGVVGSSPIAPTTSVQAAATSADARVQGVARQQWGRLRCWLGHFFELPSPAVELMPTSQSFRKRKCGSLRTFFSSWFGPPMLVACFPFSRPQSVADTDAFD